MLFLPVRRPGLEIPLIWVGRYRRVLFFSSRPSSHGFSKLLAPLILILFYSYLNKKDIL